MSEYICGINDDQDELLTADDTRWPKILCQDTDGSMKNEDADFENARNSKKTLLICGRQVPLIVVNISLSAACLILNIISIVAAPIHANAVLEANGSLFFTDTFYGACVTLVLFIGSVVWTLYTGWPGTMIHGASWKAMLIISQLGCSVMLMLNYSQDPQRTPAYLQAILNVTLIPFTILMRKIFFKRNPSIETLICTLSIVVGIVIASEPRIFNFTDAPAFVEKPHTLAHRILWPAVYALVHAPMALNMCLTEKECKKERVSVLGFMVWIHILNIVSFWSMFWTDIIPYVGTSSSIHDFGQRYLNGLQCVFGQHPQCSSMLLATWVTFFVSLLRYIVSFLLLRYTEGAVYTSMIISLGNPVGTMFWSLFNFHPTLQWAPRYSKTTTYTLIGLVFMTPAVVIYNYLSFKEGNSRKKEENEFTEKLENVKKSKDDI